MVTADWSPRSSPTTCNRTSAGSIGTATGSSIWRNTERWSAVRSGIPAPRSASFRTWPTRAMAILDGVSPRGARLGYLIADVLAKFLPITLYMSAVDVHAS